FRVPAASFDIGWHAPASCVLGNGCGVPGYWMITDCQNTAMPTSLPVFNPGFRMSTFDALVLLLGAIGSAVLYCYVGWAGMLIAFVTGHFFLFCNVLRVARPLELVWAAIFVMMSATTILLQSPGWPISLGLSLTTTVAVIVISLCRPSYHGI